MAPTSELVQWALGIVMIASALGIILLRQPVHACLSFLLTLLSLAAFYLQLGAQFIAVIQVLVYAGAILVLFMFVIILFQDAYALIQKTPSNSWPLFLFCAGIVFLAALVYVGSHFKGLPTTTGVAPAGYGTVESLGEKLYVEFFFPFEALVLLFLVALIGSVYVAKKTTKAIK